VPAKVAGVGEVIVCSPPGPDGKPSAGVLAAAALAGADRVFALGGAGAVAAMAYGTESVPRVDRIVGPGNAYVAAAKLQVVEAVAIDAPAGPSEILVITDGTASPEAVAREMLAQAEHDPEACCVTVAVGDAAGDAVAAAVERAAARAERREIVAQALRERGAVLSVDSLEEAWPFAADFAPEHLLLATASPTEHLAKVRNSGTVFLGEYASVAFGDYMTGANHVLPTAGLARAYSGLSVLDFYRWTTYQRVEREAAARLSEDVRLLATARASSPTPRPPGPGGAHEPALTRLLPGHPAVLAHQGPQVQRGPERQHPTSSACRRPPSACCARPPAPRPAAIR
jgi:histidinol dehydrogenase